ncbi:glycosyltransferase [Moritella yayanosii]|uniref:Family 2 glycosyl transferase n=1 Tax=Moritella yayanosii TaxID=69539 RepID=A0A330LZZ3_9GAMM|nr:glycosyltransferase [Moritella yayanosii]SQD79775.1 Family 2 glycosyl transferase [Moritella yayanosii]
MIYIFGFSVFLLVYIYILYPIIIFCIKQPQIKKIIELKEPSIVIIVPAHNEEQVIQEKLDNHLKLNYKNYKVLVISDTSTDQTSNIVSKYVKQYPEKIMLNEVFDGLGKTNAINKSLKGLDCDILVFSDANVYLKNDALQQVSKSFCDNNVGGVAGQLIYTNDDLEGSAESNGLYWKYEESIKMSESNTGSMMGADGSIFAIRRDLYRELPVHVLDDFCTSTGIITQGYELKFNDDIVAYEKGAESTNEEFPRKIRISNRSYNSYKFMKSEFLKELSLFNLWKMYSHKVLRWYSLLFMVIALISNIYLSITLASPFWLSTAISHITFYLVAIISWMGYFPRIPILKKLATIIEYFVMVNVAAGIGVSQSILGVKTITWKKASSTR